MGVQVTCAITERRGKLDMRQVSVVMETCNRDHHAVYPSQSSSP